MMKRVFVTGANGFVGTAVCKELITHGYSVLGLSRSEAGAQQLIALRAEVLHGDVKDEAVLKAGIEQTDAVIHTAFNHDFSTFGQNCQDDYDIIQVMGRLLGPGDRPLIVTSGAFYSGQEKNLPAGRVVNDLAFLPRVASDQSAHVLVSKGVNAMLVGLPQVHDTHRFGLISYLFPIAAEKGVSAYIDDGENLWSGVHVSDAAQVYRLVLEQGERGYKYIAVADEDIPFQQIAKIVAEHLQLPVKSIPLSQAEAHFGWFAHLAQVTLTASGQYTRQHLGWKPSGPRLFEDLANAQLDG